MSSYLDSTGVTRLATDLKAKLAEKEHEHSAADVTSGTLPVARGGTGLTANPSMLANLSSTTADDVLKASPRPGVTGTLAIANGGTGATTAAGAAANIVDDQAIAPASVAATGEVSAKAGTTTHKLTEKAQDSRADNLESSIAYVESTTARTNHASGDYFMLGDVLMKATAAIATGEQITTSNATPATVQGQIDTLRDSVSSASVDGWYIGYCIGGMGLRVYIPAMIAPTNVQVSNPQIFVNGVWHSITFDRWYYAANQVGLIFVSSSLPTLTEGYVYLVSITVTCS